jgi:hypothetical protein
MILLVFSSSLCFSSLLLPLLLDTGLTLAGELSSFPFAFSFSNFFFGVALVVGEATGGALAGLAVSSVGDSVAAFFLVLRGVFLGETGCWDTVFLVFGESDDGRTAAKVGEGRASGPSIAASSN